MSERLLHLLGGLGAEISLRRFNSRLLLTPPELSLFSGLVLEANSKMPMF